MQDFKSLKVWEKAHGLTLEIYTHTKAFPKEELYSLTSQIRRSSRSVCSCIGEAYKKRQYPNHFVSKLSDAAMENSETQVWLDVALGCNYISEEQYQK